MEEVSTILKSNSVFNPNIKYISLRLKKLYSKIFSLLWETSEHCMNNS